MRTLRLGPDPERSAPLAHGAAGGTAESQGRCEMRHITEEQQRVGMPGACVPCTSQKGKRSREGPDSCHPPTALLSAVKGPVCSHIENENENQL